MRKLLLSVLTLLFVAIYAAPAKAVGEYFPRDIFAYAEVSSTDELREFISLADLKAGDFRMDEGGKRFTDLKRVLGLGTKGLVNAEIALIGLEFNEGRSPAPQIVARMTFNRNITLQEIVEGISGKKIEEGDEPMPTLEYAGVSYFKPGDEEDGSPLVGVSGMTVFFSLAQSHFEDMIDAYNGTAPVEDLLGANARFMAWAGQRTGMARAWLDATKIRGYIERSIGDGANDSRSYEDRRDEREDEETYEERLAREERQKQREEERKTRTGERRTRDLAGLEASRALEWDKLDVVTASFSALPGSRARIEGTFKEALSWGAALPTPTTFTSVKYLPVTTLMVGGVALSNFRNVADVTLSSLREARRLALEKGAEAMEGRNAFGERMEDADRFFRNAGKIIGFGFARVATKLQETGQTEPWSGDAKTLAKLVNEPAIEGDFFSYHVTAIENMRYDAQSGEFQGLIHFSSPKGRNAVLDVGRMKTELDDSGPEPANANDNLSLPEIVEGGVAMLEFAAGFSLNDASAMLGTHAIMGGAINLANPAMGRSVRFPDGDGVFGVIALNDVKKLEERLVKLAKILPLDTQNYVLNGDRTAFMTRYEHNGARFVFGTRDVSFVLTKDALLIAPPAIAAQMLGKERPTRLMQSFASAPQGTGFFAIDFKQFTDNQGTQDLPIYVVNTDMPVDFALYANFTFTSTRFSFECTQPFTRLNQITKLNTNWNMRPGQDAQLMREFHNLANAIYQERLADEDPNNDKFPSINEAIVAKKAERARQIEEWRKEGYESEGYEEEDIETSRIFNGMIAANWQFFQSRRPVAAYLNLSDEIIALSAPDANGRRYLVTAGWGLYSVSARAYKRMLEIRDQSLASDSEITIEHFKEYQLSKLEAALLLEPLWEQEMLQDLRRRYANRLPDEGEAMSKPNMGVARFEVVQEKLVLVRIEGFGHWATYDSDFGLTDASWLQKDNED